MPDCLVCGWATSATHLGMDACRACTVFFRRNQSRRDKLQCMDRAENCKDLRKGSYTCRKCRMDRFVAVMAAGRTAESHQATDISTSMASPRPSSNLPAEAPDPEPIDCNTPEPGPSRIIIAPRPSPSHSIIDMIRSTYNTLSIWRRTAEFQFRGIFLDPFEAHREEYDIIPCTHNLMNEATRILLTGLFEFIPALFPEFSALSIAEKWLLIRNYHKAFHALDSSMRSQRRWGTDSEVHFGTYTTYLSSETADLYFSDFPDQNTVPDAARTLRACIEENCVKMQRQLSRVLTSEEEHLALMGIAFWSVENIESNERLIELASYYRTWILSDLTARYRQTIGAEESTGRIGEMYCVLLHLKSAELNLKWDYEIYSKGFDDNTDFHNLQMRRDNIDCRDEICQTSKM